MSENNLPVMTVPGHLKRLSAFDLKVIAAVTMVIDHLFCYILKPDVLSLLTGNPALANILYTAGRGVGRIAHVLFAFLLAEGFRHSSDRNKYLLRLLIFAFISQVPYSLISVSGKLTFFRTDSFNILFTFALSLAMLMVSDSIAKKNAKLRLPAAFLSMAFACAVSTVLNLEYSWYLVFLVFLFVYCPEHIVADAIITEFLYCYRHHFRTASSYFVFLGFIPLLFYNGAQGRHRYKWFFYFFYPAQYLIIMVLRALFFSRIGL